MQMQPQQIQLRFLDGTTALLQPGESLLAVAQRLLDTQHCKQMVAARCNGQLVDLTNSVLFNDIFLEDNKTPSDVNSPDSNTAPSPDAATYTVQLEWVSYHDPDGLQILRHSTAHLLAQVITERFPDAQPTVGPAIKDGFYHDFYLPEGQIIKQDDLAAIEQRMQELVAANLPFRRTVMSKAAARQYYADRHQQYKVMMVEDLPDDAIVSFYSQGDFINMCRGPHVVSTGQLSHFKLTKLAGAYWRGDSHNQMLQRIYGTAWGEQQQLEDYLSYLEQAKKRDHRRIGQQLDLFHLQEEAPGMVFWHPHGWAIYSTIKHYLEPKLRAFGYQEVNTPMIVDRSLWEKSGHWEKYREVMFTTEAEERTFAIKPMNCPDHIQIFKQGIRSWRELPIRYAEFGSCHRNEPSGSLHGLMRVRGFAQDDGHIFCRYDQIASESARFIEQLTEVYRDFGFNQYTVKLSTRPEQRIGSDAIWDQAEAALSQVLDAAGIAWELSPGDGAFYGPKIEFVLKDCLGRLWQCGTLQVDFFMPERLDATYVDENGQRQHPVMLHRAMLGSLERFIGILLEETAGKLPFWLAPVQLKIVTVTERFNEYAQTVCQQLVTQGFRAECDLRNEKVGLKIREHTLARVPIFLVIGGKEESAKTVSVRLLDGTDLGAMSVERLVQQLLQPQIARKSRTQ